MTLVRRVCSGLLAVLISAVAPGLHAQPPATPANGTPEAPPADAPTEGYQDRLIEDLPPASDDAGDAFQYDRTGWPRYLRFETRLGTEPFDAQRKTQAAVALYGLIETPNHGALSIDGSLNPSAGRGSLTVRQRELPLEGGWFGNHEAGVLIAPTPDITRRPSRVYLPFATIYGLAGEWTNPATGLSLQASRGEPGQLEVLPAAGFNGLGGRRTKLGAQWHLGASETSPQAAAAGQRPGWTFALMHEDARDVLAQGETRETGTPVDARSTLIALRHESDNHRTQGQFMSTRSSGIGNGARNGYWIDSEWDDGPRRHGLGLYHLDTDLSWANQVMPSDIEGVTARSEWRSRQFSAEGSVDWLRSVSGRTSDGAYASASARWRLSRSSQWGAGFSLRQFNGNAWSSYGDWRWDNPLGTSGLRIDLSDGDLNQTRTRQLTYDQEWPVAVGWNVSTSLSVARNLASHGSTEPDETLWTAALAFDAPVSDDAVLRGNLQTEQSSTGRRRHALNLGGNWRINRLWSVESNYVRSIGRSRNTTPIDPLAPIPSDTTTNSDRSFYAALRYEQQAGSRSVPLGGKPSDGGGRIEGVVYFDANRSGTQEANESGVPGVTVALDNRYSVRTDAQGRFEFPFVASGPRMVTVRNETLPLPWAVVGEGQVKVDVRLRETSRLQLPVQRAD